MPTALIVDDEPQASNLMAALVRLRGYRAVQASDGSEALEKARCEPPDVVLLDLMLPDRHGLDVCRELIADPATCASPVVVVSARLVDLNRDESLRAGARAFVPKPYTPDQLFEALDAAAAWREAALDPGAVAGHINFDGDEADFVGACALLRCRMLRRRAASALAVGRVLAALHELRRLEAAQHADYSIDGNELIVTIRDNDTSPALTPRGASVLAAFDTMTPRPDGVVLTKFFARPHDPPSSA